MNYGPPRLRSSPLLRRSSDRVYLPPYLGAVNSPRLLCLPSRAAFELAHRNVCLKCLFDAEPNLFSTAKKFA